MNHSFRHLLATILLASLLTACSITSEEATIHQPNNQQTQEENNHDVPIDLSQYTLVTKQADAGDADLPPVTLCNLAVPSGETLAIVSVVHVSEPVPDLCENPPNEFGQTYIRIKLEVNAVLVGEELQGELETIGLYQRGGWAASPSPGDLVLFNIRESAGDYFLGPPLFFVPNNDPELERFTSHGYREVDIPNDMDSLFSEAMNVRENYQEACGNEPTYLDPDEFYDYTHKRFDDQCKTSTPEEQTPPDCSPNHDVRPPECDKQ